MMKGRDNLRDLWVDGRIIIERILKKFGWECGLDLSGTGYSSVVCTCEHLGNTEQLVASQQTPFYWIN